jgi:hypothetical protein
VDKTRPDAALAAMFARITPPILRSQLKELLIMQALNRPLSNDRFWLLANVVLLATVTAVFVGVLALS